MDNMPEDPVPQRAAFAIEWHQALEDYITAGFTRQEAFALLKHQVEEYWSAVYTREILYAGERPTSD